MGPVFNKKLSFSYIVIIATLTAIFTFSITTFISSKKESDLLEKASVNNACSYSIKRMDGYKFIRPLMFVDEPCEGDGLMATKQEINTIIENYKTYNGVIGASVYLRNYGTNEWISVNDEEKYEPGSLFKVPIMITYLRMNEISPGVLDKEIVFNQHFAIDKNVAFKSKGLEFGKSYKIRELLRYMIQYSDNDATVLLNNNMNSDVLLKLFRDLGLEKPEIHSNHYYFTAKQYSLFMRTLYNAAYLSIDDSEFATELLSKCDFEQGIKMGIHSSHCT